MTGRIFTVPKGILDIASWKDTAYVYGLDRLSIGVSGRPVAEWEETAELKSKVPLKEADGTLTFQLPRDFAQFYAPENMTLSVIKDLVLLVIEPETVRCSPEAKKALKKMRDIIKLSPKEMKEKLDEIDRTHRT